jgi:hypothetical protein
MKRIIVCLKPVPDPNERENSLHMYYLASMSGQPDGKHRLNFITL